MQPRWSKWVLVRSPGLILLFLCLLFGPDYISGEAAQPSPYLFKDINTRTSDLSKINGLMEYKGLVFYFGHLPEGPGGLWQSDGTPGNTRQVKAGVWSGYGPAAYNDPMWVVYHDVLYFNGTDQQNGAELWRSDGSEEGTYLLRDIAPGSAGSAPSNFVEMDGWLYFIASYQLWRTDGVIVEQVTTADQGAYIYSPMVLNGMLYFTGWGQVGGEELWRTDGTPGSAQLFIDLIPGPQGSGAHPLLAQDGWLYFWATDGDTASGGHGYELWVTDGTLAGTRLFDDLNPTGNSFPGKPVPFDGGFLFTADDGVHGRELWWTAGMSGEGQPQDPVLIDDFLPGQNSSYPILLGNIGSKFLIIAEDGVDNYGLWALLTADSSPEWIKAVAPSFTFGGGGFSEPLLVMRLYQGKLFFPGYDPLAGQELWQTDGTPEGTRLSVDSWPGPRDGRPYELAACGIRLCFPANDGEHGYELWSSDGTQDGSFLVYDLNLARPGSDPGALASWGETLVFGADDGVHGPEMWRSDGTPEGTALFMDIDPAGRCGISPGRFTQVGTRLYFTACDPEFGLELWATDGQPENTRQLADLFPGGGYSNPDSFTPVGQRLFFNARIDLTKNGLFMVGEDEVVKLVKEFPLDKVGFLNGMAAFGDDLYFLQYDQFSPSLSSLWRTDGSPAGTGMVFSGLAVPGEIIHVGSYLFFSGQDLNGQAGMWRTDGTTLGTRRIPLPGGAPAYTNFRYLTHLNDTVFFFALNDQSTDLYRTNTAQDGLLLAKSFHRSEWYPSDIQPVIFTGRLVFRMQKPDNSMVLFVSDGTSTGTLQVPGAPDTISWLTPAGPFLFFNKQSSVYGNELWRWDGTLREPVQVADINPGSASSNPKWLFVLGERLYFSANDGVNGAELWAYDVPTKQVFLPVINR